LTKLCKALSTTQPERSTVPKIFHLIDVPFLSFENNKWKVQHFKKYW